MAYFIDSCKDPQTNLVPTNGYYHVKSINSSYGDTSVDYADLIIPISPNFPVPSSASIRYMCNLPGQPYYDGAVDGTYPIAVNNVTSSNLLTRINYNGVLSANTYKIFPETCESPSRIEFHVGTGSNQPGDIISFDCYIQNSIIHASFLNSWSTTITTVGTTSKYLEAGTYEITLIGGGGGGSYGTIFCGGGGGGSGGFVTAIVSLPNDTYNITCGDAGIGSTSAATANGGIGGNTRFWSTNVDFTALGGAGGYLYSSSIPTFGGMGGSGIQVSTTSATIPTIGTMTTPINGIYSLYKQDGFGSTGGSGGRGGGATGMSNAAGTGYGDGGGGGDFSSPGYDGVRGACFIRLLGER